MSVYFQLQSVFRKVWKQMSLTLILVMATLISVIFAAFKHLCPIALAIVIDAATYQHY